MAAALVSAAGCHRSGVHPIGGLGAGRGGRRAGLVAPERCSELGSRGVVGADEDDPVVRGEGRLDREQMERRRTEADVASPLVAGGDVAIDDADALVMIESMDLD